MDNKDKTISNGFGAWQNVRKENEKLKTQLLVEQENKFGQKIKINNDGNITAANNANNPFRFGNVNFSIEEKVSKPIQPIKEDDDEDEEIIMAKKHITKKRIKSKNYYLFVIVRKRNMNKKASNF